MSRPVIRSRRMFAPPIAGVLVAALAVAGPASSSPAVAPAARADALEAEGSLADAAAIWASLFREGDDLGERLVAAFRAQKAWRAAARASGDPAMLCEAQALVAEVLRLELDDEDRRDFEDFADEIRVELADAGLTSECAGAGSTTPSTDVVASPSAPATISPPPTAPLPLQRALHDDRPRAPDTARPYLISGGIVLGASAALPPASCRTTTPPGRSTPTPRRTTASA